MFGKEMPPMLYKQDEPPSEGQEEESNEPSPEKIIASLRKIILGAIVEANPDQIELLQVEIAQNPEPRIEEAKGLVGKFEVLLEIYEEELLSDENDIFNIISEIAPAMWVIGLSFEDIQNRLRIEGILE